MKTKLLHTAFSIMIAHRVFAAGPSDPRAITPLPPPSLALAPGPHSWARVRTWQGIPGIERAPAAPGQKSPPRGANVDRCKGYAEGFEHYG